MSFPYTRLGNYRILHIEPDNRIWVSRKDAVLFSDDFGQTFQVRATHRVPFPSNLARGWRLANRMLRAGILDVLPLADGSLLAVTYGRLLRCAPDETQFVPVLERAGRTMKLESLPDGTIYAGEYFYNLHRQSVNVFKSADHGVTWSIAHTFPPGEIRHVHAITYDFTCPGLLVLTGDLDRESKVLFTGDGFRTLQVLAAEGQNTRAVGIVPTPQGYFLPMDTPFQQNYVQFLARDGSLRCLCPIAGSCLAVGSANNWAFFGTAVEPSPVNLDPCAALYGTADGHEWKVIGRWQADFWSRTTYCGAVLFQMARIALPSGMNQTGYLFATTIGVQAADGVLHRWPIPPL